MNTIDITPALASAHILLLRLDARPDIATSAHGPLLAIAEDVDWLARRHTTYAPHRTAAVLQAVIADLSEICWRTGGDGITGWSGRLNSVISDLMYQRDLVIDSIALASA